MKKNKKYSKFVKYAIYGLLILVVSAVGIGLQGMFLMGVKALW